jgi:hypothetical protein
MVGSLTRDRCVPDVKLTFCWAHMRRNFYELATPGPAPIASEALRHIAEFYAIEKDIRGRSAEETVQHQTSLEAAFRQPKAASHLLQDQATGAIPPGQK